MTLASQMVSDVSDVFLNTAEHAETITYTPTGGGATSISAIVERQGNADLFEDDGRHVRHRATVHLATTAVASLDSDSDTFTFDSRNWKVDAISSSDDGMATLELVSFDYVEASDANYRLRRT